MWPAVPTTIDFIGPPRHRATENLNAKRAKLAKRSAPWGDSAVAAKRLHGRVRTDPRTVGIRLTFADRLEPAVPAGPRSRPARRIAGARLCVAVSLWPILLRVFVFSWASWLPSPLPLR